MSKIRGRAWRRQQRDKAVSRAFQRCINVFPTYRPSQEQIIKSATAPTGRCQSPFCCGNPRRLGQITIQEKRFFAEAVEPFVD